MRYALIIAGYALVLWGILTVRREAGKGRAASYRDGQAEIEAVVEEFVAAAERVRSDLDRKSAELQRLINLADDRLAKLIQAQTEPQPVQQPVSPPMSQPARTPDAAPKVAPGKANVAATPSLATRGAAVAAASYRAQAVGNDGGPADDGERVQEAQSVRAALTGDEKGTKAPPAEKKGRKERSRHAEVYELADNGQGVTEIARVTGLSKGEVQLILDLRKTR